MNSRYERVIIGAGLYGLYAALKLGEKGYHVLVLECDMAPFGRATYINQARVHQGYHYPRSISTAIKSAGYFERFSRDFSFCINNDFKKVYAMSSEYSWTDGEQFKKFCQAAHIPCEELCADKFFKPGMCDGVFQTREYTYDAQMLKTYFIDKLLLLENVTIQYGINITGIDRTADSYVLHLDEMPDVETRYVLNATYAGTNQILDMLGYEKFGIKYELCEISLCKVNSRLEGYGFTVMDGPFFSIMPFGKTGLHSLTSVTFTPHSTSYNPVPVFECQNSSGGMCTTGHLGNCNACPARPVSAFPYMDHLARKYLKDEFHFEYVKSLYSMKPILKSSEIDDSRPTVIRTFSHKPTFISVLSGKINTVYDLDEVLSDD